MFEIGKLFHLTHVVDDLAAVDDWYDDVFSVRRFYHGYEELAGRDASLVAIGDVILEPMTPARIEPLKNQSVKAFHDRFGERFHSIAWYVDDVQAIAAKLHSEGLRQYNIVGDLVTPDQVAAGAVWTHPRETPGQLEFAQQSLSATDPRLGADWTADSWRTHPLGIDGASSIEVLVRDMESAKHLYCDVLGGALIHEETVAGRKRSAFVAVGTDTVVELAEPTSTSTPEGRELATNGEMVYSLTFRTADVGRARAFLQSKDHQPTQEDSQTIVLDREEAFGMVIGFTERDLPNDPR